jgi:hypothetical protein
MDNNSARPIKVQIMLRANDIGYIAYLRITTTNKAISEFIIPIGCKTIYSKEVAEYYER